MEYRNWIFGAAQFFPISIVKTKRVKETGVEPYEIRESENQLG